MDIFGDNGAYGTVRVDVDERRCVMPIDTENPAFPQGSGGLIPVISTSRRGTERCDYAFPTGDPELAEKLTAAVGIANDVLARASELIKEDLGELVCANVQIPERGFGFTRVEVVDSNDFGDHVDPFVRLTIETSDEPGEAGTATCSIDYNAQGRPTHVALVARETEKRGVRISANWRHDLRAFNIIKIEELDGALIYKGTVAKKKRTAGR